MPQKGAAAIWQSDHVSVLPGGRGVITWVALAAFGFLIGGGTGCETSTPSERLRERLHLPSPTTFATVSRDQRFSASGQRETHVLTPRTLILIAFNRQPKIKSSYQRFKSEEARYDFFYASHDSLTPKFSLPNTWSESESQPDSRLGNRKEVDRSREHTPTVSVEKLFFDTTEMEVGVGYGLMDENAGQGNQPFVSASLRYPLWASRERLERTSEEIFRRSELNDAQLDFIQTVREELQEALEYYYSAIFNTRLRDAARSRREDVERLLQRLDEITDRDASADRRRIEAEVATVKSDESSFNSFVQVQTSRLKSACGLPFHARTELQDVLFNPFEGLSHEDLLWLGIETDPEIATLRNAMSNAQVQLDLARRGKWDVALLADGKTHLEGRGMRQDQSDWTVSLGLEVSAVDARVTSSLIRQAQADIERFGEAISARENTIYVNTLEPFIRNAQLTVTRQELIDNLSKYQQDYETGVSEYLAGNLNIDDLLKRRGDLWEQQRTITRQAFFMGVNVAFLCAETGKFFELLNGGADAESTVGEQGLPHDG